MPDNVPLMAKPKKEAQKLHNVAVMLGRRGGLKRAKNRTFEELSAIGRRAAEARWGKHRVAKAETPTE